MTRSLVFEHSHTPANMTELEEVQQDILRESEIIAKEDVFKGILGAWRRRRAVKNVAKSAEWLCGQEAYGLQALNVVAEAAATTQAPALIEIVEEQLEEVYPRETDNAVLARFNEAEKRAYLEAIEATDGETSFKAALSVAEARADKIIGLQPDFTNADAERYKLLTEQYERDKTRRQRVQGVDLEAENTLSDDAVKISPDELFKD
jgi:hypothetical protein